MRPRWRKVFSDLWSNKTRSMLVIASITIGLFAVGLITSMYVILTADMPASYASTNPANIELSLSDFDGDLVKQVAKLEGVAETMGQRDFSAQIQTGDGEWVAISFHAVHDLGQLNLNRVTIQQGVYPPLNRQMVVDIYKFASLKHTLGQSATIKLTSNRLRQMPLVGTVHDLTIGAYSEGGGFFLAPTQAYITLETLPWLEQPQKMNRLLVRATQVDADRASLQTLAQRISDYVKKDGVAVYSFAVRPTNSHPNEVYVQAIASVLILLGGLVMFLSAFLITNTLSALLNQQVQQIGIMKTIGARRGQIIAIYLMLILIYSLIALAIAIPVASRSAYLLLGVLAGQVNLTLQGYRAVPLAILIQLGIALVVPQLAALYPILHGTRISPVEAFSGVSQASPAAIRRPENRKRNTFSTLLGRLSRPLLISLRNTFRRKGRLALTLVTLTLGGAIFIATFNVRGSMTSYINRIGRYFLSDVNLTLDGYQRKTEVENIIKTAPGVKAVEGWALAGAQLVLPDGSDGERFALLGPPAGSLLVEPILLEGRWVGNTNAVPGLAESQFPNEIAVNERFREQFPDLQVGSILRAKIFNQTTDLIVVGFFQMAGRSSGYLAYSTYETLSSLIHQENKANTFRVTADRSGLTNAQQKALGVRIQALLEANGFRVTEVESGLTLTATTSDGLTILSGFLMIMAVMIALVGSIGLTGTLSMNVLERTREIGIMRSIGANNRILTRLVMVEGLLIGLLSWAFGVLLAFPISTALSNGINLALFGAPVAFTFTYTGILLWLGVVTLLSTLASVIPARSASRLTIREVLAYE